MENGANVAAFLEKLNQNNDDGDDDDCQFSVIPNDPPEKPSLHIQNVVSLYDQNFPAESFNDFDDFEAFDFQNS